MKRFTISLISLLGLMCLIYWQPVALCDEQAQISGKVTLPDGSPASGARVEAIDPWKQYQTVATAIADESGAYSLDLPPGRYALRVSRGVYVFYSLRTDFIVEAKAGAPASGPVDVNLKKGCVIHGSVMDVSSGQMVGDADVYSYMGGHTVANSDGSFQMILPKSSYTLTAVKKGYYQPIMHINATNSDTLAVMIETKPGGIIRGKVTDEQGKPVEGASVGSGDGYFHFQFTKTDAQGNYEIEGFDPNAYVEVSANKDGYEYERISSVSFPSGQREMTLDFTFKKSSTRTITGRVTKPDGSPAADVRVAYGSSSCDYGYTETRTKEDGSFELANVHTSKRVIMAHTNGFAPAFTFVDEGKSAEVELQLKPGHFIEGQFVDEEGKPAKNVHMSVCVEDPAMDKLGFCGRQTYRWLYQGISVGDDGKFKLDSLPEKRIIIETSFGTEWSPMDSLALEVDRTDHVITVRSGGEVAGKVVRADTGEPITSFKARITDARSPYPGYSSPAVVSRLRDGMDFNSTEGTFSIFGVTSGATVSVEVDAPGFRTAAMNDILVQPKGNADFSQAVFKLHPSAGFGGVIKDAETGMPVEDVLVTVIDGGRGIGDHFQWRYASNMKENIKSARTDAQGVFKLDYVASRSGHVMLEKPGYARVLVRNADFGKGFEHGLSKGATISGVVTDDSGNPESGVSISVELLGAGTSMVSYDYLTTDSEGRFKSENLPGGRYVINQRRISRVDRMLEADIAAGEDYVVDWDRPGEAVLEGMVTLEGKPVEGAHILIHPMKGGMYSGTADTGKDGKYRISLYKAGDYKVTLSQGEWTDPNHIRIKKIAQIKPGKNELSVEFPSAAISGKVLDASGKPVKGLTVRAYRRATEQEEIGVSEDGNWSWQHTDPVWWPRNTGTTDENGAFELKNIIAGEWLVAVVDGQNVGVHTKPFKLKERQKKSDVMIRMCETGRVEVGVVDPVTGEAMKSAYPVLIDDFGFVYYMARGESSGCGVSSCAPGETVTDVGRSVFLNIPPGSYRVTATTIDYTLSSARVDVKTGEVTKVDLKPQPGQKIIFRLKETEGDTMPGVPWVGFRITRAGTNQPVIEDYRGPNMGDVIFFKGENPREAVIPIKPGKYDLRAVLRKENSTYMLSAKENLWNYQETVEVKAGEDLVIEVPWQ